MATGITPQHNIPLYYQTFQQGHPKSLGILTIIGGIVQIILGIASACIPLAGISLLSGIDFWGAIIYIIAGSLTIAAHVNVSICLIKGSLGMNITTAVFSAISFILDCVDMSLLCLYSGWCAILVILLLSNVLMFIISIYLSVVGCRALGHEPNTVQQVIVMQNSHVITVSQ